MATMERTNDSNGCSTGGREAGLAALRRPGVTVFSGERLSAVESALAGIVLSFMKRAS